MNPPYWSGRTHFVNALADRLLVRLLDVCEVREVAAPIGQQFPLAVGRLHARLVHTRVARGAERVTLAGFLVLDVLHLLGCTCSPVHPPTGRSLQHDPEAFLHLHARVSAVLEAHVRPDGVLSFALSDLLHGAVELLTGEVDGGVLPLLDALLAQYPEVQP